VRPRREEAAPVHRRLNTLVAMTSERLTPQQCLRIYGQVWFASDPAARLELVRQCCTEDVRFVDDQGVYEGAQAVADMIGNARSAMGSGESTASATGRSGGGVTVEVTTAIESLHDFFRYSFVWKFPDGSRYGGTDFCEVADDGRMKLITVWGESKDFPVS
jgi:hypothetical protein